MPKEKRREFTAKTKREALARAGGKCEMCSRMEGRYEFDHIRPNRRHGTNDLDNCMVLCKRCHQLKTRADMHLITQENRRQRRRERALGADHPPRSKSKWPSRPFPPTKRRLQSRGFRKP